MPGSHAENIYFKSAFGAPAGQKNIIRSAKTTFELEIVDCLFAPTTLPNPALGHNLLVFKVIHRKVIRVFLN